MKTPAILAAAVLLLAACSSPTPAAAPSQPPAAKPTPAQTATLPKATEKLTLDPARFTADLSRNRFYPMPVGATRIIREVVTDDEGTETLTKRITVSGKTKRLPNGITARVVRDDVFNEDGTPHEQTLDYVFADQATGDIWYGGEQTRTWNEDTEGWDTSGSFEAGKAGGQAGILMLNNPQVGDAYRIEYVPGAEPIQDSARVIAVNQTVKVPAFDEQITGCVLIEEWSPHSPDIEHKTHCPGIGFVLSSLVASEGDERMYEELVNAK